MDEERHTNCKERTGIRLLILKSLNREILRLSIPAVVSNITVPLLGLCDTAISGHLGSELFLGAIAVGSVMLNVVFWLFGFLRMGTTGLTATALGSGDELRVKREFTCAFAIAVIVGVVLIALQVPLFEGLSKLVGVEKELEEPVKSYFNIRIWGSPALLAVMAISGWFVGMQSTLFPMIIAISVNVINILASFLLVFIGEMGFPGVAVGTLVSNWVGVLIALLCCLFYGNRRLPFCSLAVAFEAGIGRYFKVNGNLFLRSFFIICVTLGVTAAGARLGTMVLAVNVIIMQFFQFFSFFMDGFAFAAEAMVGLRVGERNRELLVSSVKYLLMWTLGMVITFSLFYFGALDIIVGLLTDTVSVREEVSAMWIWVVLIPVVCAWAFIFDGFYIGLTDTGKMMISTFLAAITFFLIAFIDFHGGIEIRVVDNSRIWCAFLGYMAVRGIFLASCFPKSLDRCFR